MLEGKKFLVAGAGGLLGSKLAAALVNDDAQVIAADISLDLMKKRLVSLGLDTNSPSLSCIALDLNDTTSVVDFFATINDVDGAVNCSYPRNKRYGAKFFDVSLADFNENVSLHLGSSFFFIQQCAAYFKRVQIPFSLVNISSIYGVVAPKFEVYDNTPMTMPVEYAAIKAALLHLSKYVTSYVGDSAFRSNSVSPGGIYDHQPEQFLEQYKKQTLGRGMLDIEDVIGSIKFLLSDSARYVNGQNIIVDDGFSL
ncbi:NAD(P)-dependent dehydrogenase, short-chain alcohol dehydrogenase family [Pseudomonas cedrina]|uniref:Flagellin modification protein A n=2 Tax=Pseudomonas cedrina TaxID=651740 RepID=A0A1V2KG24_PSECE|nr:oxidoreductase [Pseudomonas cedrina]ONH56707.1 flagellin modification protein A [Pseudomonas cedrina subsp. cedrina]SDS15332.1 NAD(P)-dependent dehydrogenase, short-chain alcohol dehydrogenase family [Pseudomonas cedrina]